MLYLDHHATTPVLPEVVEAMRPFWSETFGNPSSAHAFGRKARQALEDAREKIARLLEANPDELLFTSGATESNNLAIFGLVGSAPGHVLASPIEHPCVIEPVKQLAARGFEVEWLPVQSNGRVHPDAVTQRLRPDTRLVTMMLVNHETGARQPVEESALAARSALVHCDAAQALAKVAVSFRSLNVTTLSASGHKIGAPKGIGILLLKRGTRLNPLVFGGHQQHGRRPGTEPVALAVGFAKALEIAGHRLSERASDVSRVRSALIERLHQGAPPILLNSPTDGSPYVVNISFPGCRADLLLMKLDLLGVACSTGSACSSGSLLPSPVLRAMGVDQELLSSALRFSFSSSITLAEIDEAAICIIKAVKDLRQQMSNDPL